MLTVINSWLYLYLHIKSSHAKATGKLSNRLAWLVLLFVSQIIIFKEQKLKIDIFSSEEYKKILKTKINCTKIVPIQEQKTRVIIRKF
jgi:hypothetical protein